MGSSGLCAHLAHGRCLVSTTYWLDTFKEEHDWPGRSWLVGLIHDVFRDEDSIKILKMLVTAVPTLYDICL